MLTLFPLRLEWIASLHISLSALTQQAVLDHQWASAVLVFLGWHILLALVSGFLVNWACWIDPGDCQWEKSLRVAVKLKWIIAREEKQNKEGK